MMFPTILLLSLPFLANAIPQRQPVSVNPHLALAGRLINTRDVADECPTCTTFATTVADCLQLTTLEETSTCLCTTAVFNDLNTCIECPAVTSSDQYADLVSSSSQLTTSCAQLGVTGLPAVDPIPAATSSPQTDSVIASDADAASTTAAGEESAPTTAATTAGVVTTHSGTTTTKAVVSPTGKTSTKAVSASSSASASVAASSGSKSFGGSSIFVGAVGVVGVWAALI